jgi:hypothetical protein
MCTGGGKDSVFENVRIEYLKFCIHSTLQFFSMWPNPGCCADHGSKERGQLLAMHEKYHIQGATQKFMKFFCQLNHLLKFLCASIPFEIVP